MADRSIELFEALLAQLEADAPLVALIGTDSRFSPAAPRIYDDVPDGAPLPYLTLGDGTATDAGGSLVDAQEHTFTVHVWSEKPTSKEARTIAAAVRAALHDRPLTLSAGRCPNLRHEFSETLRDPDGITRHVVMRFRAVTHD